uniref:Thaumatin-like protein n=1 Tax=Aegilops tauschii TaxID=37682 RepID=M8C4V8_AEGTA
MASSLSFILALLLAIAATDAITVHVLNKCPYTVWPGAVPVGGGSRLDPGQAAAIQVPPGTAAGRIWGRTGCNFDASGHGSCHAISCAADINAKCPSELKMDGGCSSACLKFGTPKYCCTPPLTPSTCGPTDYSRFFKGLCPDAYSYAYDDKSSSFTCPVGSDYQVTFCP